MCKYIYKYLITNILSFICKSINISISILISMRLNIKKRDQASNLTVSGRAIDNPEQIKKDFIETLERTQKYKNVSHAVWDLILKYIEENREQKKELLIANNKIVS